jgi:hypothetical protein
MFQLSYVTLTLQSALAHAKTVCIANDLSVDHDTTLH